jgi:hypothetical protein
MAEFKDVHRNMVRMCDAMRAEDNGCAPCPLDGICAKFITLSEDAIATIERVVTQWAAEHPDPVYPSWEEGWKQLFPETKSIPCLSAFGINECSGFNSCIKCKKQPMPAEVAKKLGIKPIAPEKPAPEHDGCEGCKWCSKTEKEEPCVNCRGTLYGGGDEKPDLWERK